MKKILFLIGLGYACLIGTAQKSKAIAWPANAADSLKLEANCLDSAGNKMVCDSIWIAVWRGTTVIDSGRTTTFPATIGTTRVYLRPGRDSTYIVKTIGQTTAGQYSMTATPWGGTYGGKRLNAPVVNINYEVGALVTSTYLAAADDRQLLGTAYSTPTTAGVPEVELANTTSQGGTAMVITGERIVMASTTAGEPALKLTGNTTGAGLLSTGGATGNGATFAGGSSAGTQQGVSINGGPSGVGLLMKGGSTTGSAESTNVTLGFSRNTNTTSSGATMNVTIPLVTTTTTATNVTTVNGLAANVITAASIADLALDSASFAADYYTKSLRSAHLALMDSCTGVGVRNASFAANGFAASAITAAAVADAAIDSATFANDVRANFFDRVIHTGTAAGATATTLTLAANSFANDEIVGDIIYVRSGTGAGQARRIVDFVASTEIATVDSAFATTPTGAIYFIYPDADRGLLANSPSHGGSAAVITGNRVALTSTSGPGLSITGGSNAVAFNVAGSGALGIGMRVTSTSDAVSFESTNGVGLAAVSSGEKGAFFHAGGNFPGLQIDGAGTNAGLLIRTEGTGPALQATAGGNSAGVLVQGSGTGNGATVTAGTSAGAVAVLLKASTTSGSAESLSTTSGHGIAFGIAGTGAEQAPGIASNVADSGWMSAFAARNGTANSFGQAATTNLNTLGWAQTGAGGSSCTFGTTYTDTIYFRNTTTSSNIPNAIATIKNASQATLGKIQADANGRYVGTFDAQTYLIFPHFLNGISWTDNPDTFVVTGNGQNDTVRGETIALPSPPVGGQITVTGNVYDLLGDSVPGVTVEFSLNQNAYFSIDDTTNMILVTKMGRSRQTGVDGRWSIALYPTTKLLGDDRRKGVYYTCKIYMPDGITTYENSGQITFSHTPSSQTFQYKNYRPWVTQ